MNINKRIFDLVVASVFIVFLSPLLVFLYFTSFFSTGANGLFIQARVGRNGRLFGVYKFRTMRPHGSSSTVTVLGDARITPVGSIMRKLKLDELPQLFNVLSGQMSIVGPRPDTPGFADTLPPHLQDFLLLTPGITSPASLAFRNEESLLAGVDNPILYNKEVIWPAKVQINRYYARTSSLGSDLLVSILTVLAVLWPKKFCPQYCFDLLGLPKSFLRF